MGARVEWGRVIEVLLAKEFFFLNSLSTGKWTTYRAMARDTVDRAVQVGALNDPRGCQTDGFLLVGGEAWHPTLFIRLVQDYGLEVEVSQGRQGEQNEQNRLLSWIFAGCSTFSQDIW